MVYILAGAEGLVKFTPSEVQALFPVQKDGSCPEVFSVILKNGKLYHLEPRYYAKIKKSFLYGETE